MISGDQRRIDIADMQTNTIYSGGYASSQPYIQSFWSVISELDDADQANFLQFVTSCPRQPLLGFQQLYPKFCIQQVRTTNNMLDDGVIDGGIGGDAGGEKERLPSASTCINLLKLPKYNTKLILKEKLLYAIRSNSRFELS